MDDIIEAVIDFVGSLLETAFMSIKNPKKRKWSFTIFYSVVLLAVVGFLLWGTFALVAEGNDMGAAVFGAIAALLFIIFGALIIRGHRQNWKSKEKE